MNFEEIMEIIKTLPNVQETVNKLSISVNLWKGVRNIVIFTILAMLFSMISGQNQINPNTNGIFFVVGVAIIYGVIFGLASVLFAGIFWSILTRFGAKKENFKLYYYISSIYAFPFLVLTIIAELAKASFIGTIIYVAIAIIQFFYWLEILKVCSELTRKKIAKVIIILVGSIFLIVLLTTIILVVIVTSTGK